MNVPLVLAGALTLVGAAIHGGAGEVLVVRRISPAGLPSSPFGGGGFTKSMIRATWHLTTIAFVTDGLAFVLAGSILSGDAARAIGLLAAVAATANATLIFGAGLSHGARSLRRGDRRLLLHPAPVLFVAVLVLGWWGVAI